MWQHAYDIETNSKKETIWKLWTDVKNWNKWHTAIEYSYLDGKFVQGTWGSFKVTDQVNTLYLSFQLSKCIPNQLYTLKIKLTLCTIEIGHELTDEANRQKIRFFIKISGPLAFVHIKKIGRIFILKTQKSIKTLIELAQRITDEGDNYDEERIY